MQQKPPAKRQRSVSDDEQGTDKPGLAARLVLDGMERGEAYYWIHDNRRQVIMTQNGLLVKGDQATLYVAGTPYRLKYTGTLGNWKIFDRFVA